MSFSSLEFLFGFLPIFLAVYFLTPASFRNLPLLLGSLVFYGWGVSQRPWCLAVLAGLLLVVTGIFFFLRRRKITLPDTPWTAIGAGLITGMSTGMFNIVGPFLLIYYMNVARDTLHMKASLEFSFLIAGLYSAAMHLLVYKNITTALLPAIGCAVVAVLAAGVLGLKLYRRIDRDKIALAIYILLPIMAGTLIWNGLG